MPPPVGRRSAEERREAVLAAAIIEFAKGGLFGTSTKTISDRAGISHPYLFRLYPTKQALFLAAVERAFTEFESVANESAGGLHGVAARQAVGDAYLALLGERPTLLAVQMHAYAASTGSDEVRQATRRHLGRLWDALVESGGLSEEEAQALVAYGVLRTVTSALGSNETPSSSPVPSWAGFV